MLYRSGECDLARLGGMGAFSISAGRLGELAEEMRLL